VSPSWRDRVTVFLGPTSVELARFGKGIRPRLGMSFAQPCQPEKSAATSSGSAQFAERAGATSARTAPIPANGVPWRPALDALDRALQALEWGSADAHVTLSSHFVRYALVPGADKLRGTTERVAAARHQLRGIYGERAEGWRLAIGANGGSSMLVAAIDPEFADGIKASLAAAKLRPAAMEPYVATAFNLCRKSIGTEAWLAVAEPGRLALVYFKNGAWLRLRNQRLRNGVSEELPLALEQACLAEGIEAAAGRVLLVSREPAQVEFPPGSGWSLEPVRAGETH
jgi:hypothetical protein